MDLVVEEGPVLEHSPSELTLKLRVYLRHDSVVVVSEEVASFSDVDEHPWKLFFFGWQMDQESANYLLNYFDTYVRGVRCLKSIFHTFNFLINQ